MSSGRQAAFIGAAAGLLVWLYDYDFLLNAGGPATPMSRALLAAAGLGDASALVIVFWPLAVMVGLGAALGFAVKVAIDCVRAFSRRAPR